MYYIPNTDLLVRVHNTTEVSIVGQLVISYTPSDEIHSDYIVTTGTLCDVIREASKMILLPNRTHFMPVSSDVFEVGALNSSLDVYYVFRRIARSAQLIFTGSVETASNRGLLTAISLADVITVSRILLGQTT